jgi:predicted XRE-type DNA-binding protein
MTLLKRDPERLQKLRTAIRYLLSNDALERGHQSRLAEHFDVSRQRVHQVLNEEQDRRTRGAAIRRVAEQRRQREAIAAMFPQRRDEFL